MKSRPELRAMCGLWKSRPTDFLAMPTPFSRQAKCIQSFCLTLRISDASKARTFRSRGSVGKDQENEDGEDEGGSGSEGRSGF
jgi:hypothetical protein